MSESNIGKWIKFGEFKTVGDLKDLIGGLDDKEDLGFINGPREHLYRKEEDDGSVWFGFQPDEIDLSFIEECRKPDDGGPAFPVSHYDGDELTIFFGMSLRDYFAGQALMGICADPGIRMMQPGCAYWAYQMADAILEARKEGRK